jgi:hypothetical protein
MTASVSFKSRNIYRADLLNIGKRPCCSSIRPMRVPTAAPARALRRRRQAELRRAGPRRRRSAGACEARADRRRPRLHRHRARGSQPMVRARAPGDSGAAALSYRRCRGTRPARTIVKVGGRQWCLQLSSPHGERCARFQRAPHTAARWIVARMDIARDQRIRVAVGAPGRCAEAAGHSAASRAGAAFVA